MRNQPSTHAPRGGLSIIEVLTSIVVAMIGVFGIMIFLIIFMRVTYKTK